MKKIIICAMALCVLMVLFGCTPYDNEQTSDGTLKAPPVLTVINGKESIEALKGTYSLTYNNGDGTATSVEADSLHPLQARELMPELEIKPTPYSSVDPLSAYLQWDAMPDKVSVRCWNEDCWGQYDAKSEEIEVNTLSGIDDQTLFVIKMKEGNYIYEIIAEWNSSEEFCGTAHYSFYTASFYNLDVSEMIPVEKKDV